MLKELLFDIYYLIYTYPVFFIFILGAYIFFILLILKKINFKLLSKNVSTGILILVILNLVFIGFIVLNITERTKEISSLENQLKYGAVLLEKYKEKNLKYPESLDDLESDFEKNSIEGYKYEKYARGDMVLKIEILGTYKHLCYNSSDKQVTLESPMY